MAGKALGELYPAGADHHGERLREGFCRAALLAADVLAYRAERPEDNS